MKTDFLAISFSFLTLFGLTGCELPQTAIGSKPLDHTAPCRTDTVYVEVGSSAWWGVLPSSDIELPREIYGDVLDTARWYWAAPADTAEKTRTIRHAIHTRDTVTTEEVLYRDSTGKWHIIADSLAQELALLEDYRRKSYQATGVFFGIVLLGFGAFLIWHFINVKNKQHQR